MEGPDSNEYGQPNSQGGQAMKIGLLIVDMQNIFLRDQMEKLDVPCSV